LVMTGLILWIAFGKLSAVYETGLQTLNESARARPKHNSQFRLVRVLSESTILGWFLKSSVSKASFQLVSAYMFRDRDTKLRLYPGLAPAMVMPIVMLFSTHGFGSSRSSQALGSGFDNFFVAFAAIYVCIVPLSALNLLKFSQQWRASEVFVAAPITGPAPLLQGARVAVVLFLSVPMLIVLTVFMAATHGLSAVWLILPGVIALPVYAMIPGVTGNATPLSNPIEEAKSMSNLPVMMGSMFAAMAIGGLATAASVMGFLAYFLVLESIASLILCLILRTAVSRSTWRSYD